MIDLGKMNKDQIRKEKRPMLVKDIPENFELVTDSRKSGLLPITWELTLTTTGVYLWKS